MHVHNYMHMNYYVFRSADTQPVSGVLSSQVTAVSNSSSEYIVLLTFKYSIEVSSLLHSVIMVCNNFCVLEY